MKREELIYFVTTLLRKRFHDNFEKQKVDIIDSLTLISAEAIDNAMTVLVKTMSTISD